MKNNWFTQHKIGWLIISVQDILKIIFEILDNVTNIFIFWQIVIIRVFRSRNEGKSLLQVNFGSDHGIIDKVFHFYKEWRVVTLKATNLITALIYKWWIPTYWHCIGIHHLSKNTYIAFHYCLRLKHILHHISTTYINLKLYITK